MRLMEPARGTDPAWFGIAAVLNKQYGHQLKDYLAFLQKHGGFERK